MATYSSLAAAKTAWRNEGGSDASKPNYNYLLNGVLTNAFTGQTIQSADTSSQSTPPTGGSSASSPSKNTEWYLSGWTIDGAGNWTQKPTLKINGQTFQYENPQDYINKLNELKAQGVSGNIDPFINQLQTIAVPAYQTKISSQGSQAANPSTTPASDGLEGIGLPGNVPTASSSAQELADYVYKNNLQNVGQYDWWSGNPNKNAAWDLVQKATASGQARNVPINTDLSVAEREQFWSDFTKMQQALLENPEQMDALLREVKVFDKVYDTISSNLLAAKKLNIDKLNLDYSQAIEKINLSNKQTDEQKTEAIKGLTQDYISAHEELNYSKELALKNAVTTLKRTSEQAGGIAAKNYLETVAKNITGGNIAKLSANQLMSALDQSRKEVKEQFEIDQLEIEMKRRKAISSLEQQVGSDQARQIVASAESADPSLTNQNLESILSGNLQNVRQQALFGGSQLGGTATGLRAIATQPAKFGGITGSLQQQAAQRRESGALGAAQGLAQTELGKQIQEQELSDKLAQTEATKKASQVGFLQTQVPYTKFFKDPATGKYVVGGITSTGQKVATPSTAKSYSDVFAAIMPEQLKKVDITLAVPK